ncbi:MAG: carbamoyl-phosphate synthase large subunit [Deltaproteobacteria bacterium]|nr:carbamoyl-phosphate synthase large subunit [Deltaproteobacteria bacterium]
MALRALLVANRGEIAIRVLRAAADLGLRTVAVHGEDDAASLHARMADEARPLPGAGPAAYLDVEAVVAAARTTGCDAVHPGYGFLAERADFATRAAEAGLVFVGPSPETLAIFGDKARARALAAAHDVPLLAGTSGPTSRGEAAAFLAAAGGAPIALKAIAGGGGRGMRIVRDAAALAEAWERCRSEATAAFGNGDLYAERWLARARHIEVQVVGDGSGAVAALGERECSLQRRHQKLVEIAPSPGLAPALRARLVAAALRMAAAVRYASLGTFEFLVDAAGGADTAFYFLEANPRLQVEHTVTEVVTGVDLVATQLRLAGGATLADVGLASGDGPAPRGHAIELRINMETMRADADAVPGGGTITAYEPASGPGVRVDGCGYAGYTTNPRFDSLLAKLVVHAPTGGLPTLLARAARALAECRIEGVPTNLDFLHALVTHPDVVADRVDTGFVGRYAPDLVAAAAARVRRRPQASGAEAAPLAGARVDRGDPLAVLAHGKSGGRRAGATARADADATLGDDALAVRAHMQGTVVSVDVAEGDTVAAGDTLLVMEAMKMEHVVAAERAGVVRRLAVAAGDTVFEGHLLVLLAPTDAGGRASEAGDDLDLEHVRADLAEAFERHAVGLDAARPEAVARRRAAGQRTARENVGDLCDPGSFVEYGALVIAAQRQRRSVEDLIAKTPADGLVAGIGTVNAATARDRASCVVLAYDYTVLAGTQGAQNHRKKDRMLEVAARERLPVVLFSEGGGGRPGDTDALGIAGLDVPTFQAFARLSGLVPLVGINSGFCFAGNAALLGCCDVVIATAGSNIGMGGPAMVEGGGLGVFRPEEIGPMAVQSGNGVVDVAVADEAEAVRVAKRYLGFFQGPLAEWSSADQRRLRALVPENRLRVYDVRKVVTTLADAGSVLELRRPFGRGMVTALARIEGRPVGIVANDPTHLAGAIDADGADKAARFLQLCDAFDVPVVFLCDTPGIMVGPEIEKRALVRHAARLFLVGASLTTPFCTIVLRKGYGLGAMAMAGGSFKAGLFTMAWPTGEFGGMGLEGAVKLGFRKELAALTDPAERRALYDGMVERLYRHGKGVSAASHFEIDDVIDPADTRRVIASAFAATPAAPPRHDKKRPCIDAW